MQVIERKYCLWTLYGWSLAKRTELKREQERRRAGEVGVLSSVAFWLKTWLAHTHPRIVTNLNSQYHFDPTIVSCYSCALIWHKLFITSIGEPFVFVHCLLKHFKGALEQLRGKSLFFVALFATQWRARCSTLITTPLCDAKMLEHGTTKRKGRWQCYDKKCWLAEGRTRCVVTQSKLMLH